VDKFVHRQNLAHYVGLLHSEEGPDKRAQIQRLLIEELEGIASRPQQMVEVSALIELEEARLERGRAGITQLASHAAAQERAQVALARVQDLVHLLCEWRSALASEGA